MRFMSLGTRLVLVLGVVGTGLYLLVVDVGISAGRIHHGVSVAGVELGGLTEAEAMGRLQERARAMKDAPLVVSGAGIERLVSPRDLEWRPNPERSAKQAMRIGRDHLPFGALVDRVRGWLAPIELEWAGRHNPKRVVELVDGIEQEALERGLELDRGMLRYRIRKAITTWPRRPVEIPPSAP
ncbi:MAG: hypothetical protein ABR529_05035 [Actinomycetota bacterium]